jgi:quinol-cytochrome oxidoreductase complex cytochrome b subunit
MEWELGQKADPLASAYPGIKPEWYFLWEYQLLKEFPPHDYGPFEREVVLPLEVDPERVEAEQRSGLLWISLPLPSDG